MGRAGSVWHNKTAGVATPVSTVLDTEVDNSVSRTGKYGMGRQGRVSTVFTFQEERTIKEKILAYADMSGEKSLSLSLATQFFKQEMERLKAIHPERDFKNLSVTTGEAFDYMWSRR